MSASTSLVISKDQHKVTASTLTAEQLLKKVGKNSNKPHSSSTNNSKHHHKKNRSIDKNIGNKKSYGWVPDLPDKRDHKFQVSKPTILLNLPSKVDLTDKCPSVYDQGALGSCTANAIAGAIEFDIKKQKLDDFMPSRLFIYYNERDIEGTTLSDSGAMIRDGIKSVNKQGVCHEDMWPYDISQFTDKPPSNCYDEALDNIVLSYQRMERDIHQMRGCLAEGYPFVIGFTVYSYFESPEMAQNGILNIPDPDEEQVLGGHAVLVVGYNDETKRFKVRNSWSDKWGQNGYFEMPYEYLLDENLSDDFWCIKVVK